MLSIKKIKHLFISFIYYCIINLSKLSGLKSMIHLDCSDDVSQLSRSQLRLPMWLGKVTRADSSRIATVDVWHLACYQLAWQVWLGYVSFIIWQAILGLFTWSQETRLCQGYAQNWHPFIFSPFYWPKQSQLRLQLLMEKKSKCYCKVCGYKEAWSFGVIWGETIHHNKKNGELL